MAPRRIKADAILEAARAEANQEPLELELFGVVHELPPELPAAALIGFSRLAAQDGSGLTMALEAMLTKPVVEDLITRDLTYPQLLELMTAIANEYGVALGKLPGSAELSPSTS